MSLNERLKAIKVVPVIAIHDANKAAKLAQVLVENGLPCAEVTFRTPAAAQAIKNMRAAFPDMLIGSGTILTLGQVDESIAAGVDFVVSPGLNPNVVKYCEQRNVTIVPGVNNPSLIEQAMEMGLTTLKFFPAEPSGGVDMLKALSAVYPVEFMPTGGISPNNINDYLAISSVLACGGTWMIPNDLVENEKWDEIGQLVRAVTHILF